MLSSACMRQFAKNTKMENNNNLPPLLPPLYGPLGGARVRHDLIKPHNKGVGVIITPVLQLRTQRCGVWPLHTDKGRQGLEGNLIRSDRC